MLSGNDPRGGKVAAGVAHGTQFDAVVSQAQIIPGRAFEALLLTILLVAQSFFPHVARAASGAPPAVTDTTIVRLLEKLNAIPEKQLDDRTNPTLNVLRAIDDADGPDYLRLRRLMGKADVRRMMHPGVKCVVGNMLAQRWDTFLLAGNLFLAGLQTQNPALRVLARRKLTAFIQPGFVPELIRLLGVPGASAPAYDILKEISGKTYKPEARIWRVWWVQQKAKADIVGRLLADTQARLIKQPIPGFNQARFWYAPAKVSDLSEPENKRSEEEQSAMDARASWVQTDVRRYALAWGHSKPLLDRIIHQPDPRVNHFLERLLADPGYGDYASLVLAWRSSAPSLPVIAKYAKKFGTPGRALARGSLGDKTALQDLLKMIEAHPQPLMLAVMDSSERAYLGRLHAVGVLPAEQAYELLCHYAFNFEEALTENKKKKATHTAARWLNQNERWLTLDHRRNYYVAASK